MVMVVSASDVISMSTVRAALSAISLRSGTAPKSDEDDKDAKVWRKSNQKTMTTITLVLANSPPHHVRNCKAISEAWKKLTDDNIFMMHLASLLKEYDNLIVSLES
jgi:hypothetical protein